MLIKYSLRIGMKYGTPAILENRTKGMKEVRRGRASSFRRHPTIVRCKHLPIVRKAGADGCRLSKLRKLNIVYIRSRVAGLSRNRRSVHT